MKNFTPQGVIRTAEERLSCGLQPTIQFACDGVGWSWKQELCGM